MFNVIIRLLKKEDIESVEKIFDLYWDDEFRNNLSKKIKNYFNNDVELINQNFKFFVAEENEEVIGVAGIRKLPKHMKEYATTNNPMEFYVLAVKNRGKRIGSTLTLKLIDESKKEGYTEILLFSGEKHKESWKFHDKYFNKVGSATAPNGEPGYIWGKLI